MGLFGEGERFFLINTLDLNSIVFYLKHLERCGLNMAIFGDAVMRSPEWSENHPIRAGNDWDVFLNYFFAVLFMICFLVGVIIDPLIILYHSKQKTTFAKVLFLLISVIDLVRSIYFPLVLVPKLLSPLDDIYYDYDPSSTHWTSYSNKIIFNLLEVQQEILVVLCVSRYFSIVDPLSNAKKRNSALSVILVMIFVKNIVFTSLEFLHEPLGYHRIQDSLITMNLLYIKETIAIVFIISCVLRCAFLLIGGVFSGLTILHLKRSDTASCESSERNVRKGIIAIVAMNVFNVFVIILAVINSIIAYEVYKKLPDSFKDLHSTGKDFMHFALIYGITLTQSTFNTLSFLLICRTFRDFLKRMIPIRIGKVDIRQEVSVNHSAGLETVM